MHMGVSASHIVFYLTGEFNFGSFFLADKCQHNVYWLEKKADIYTLEWNS